MKLFKSTTYEWAIDIGVALASVAITLVVVAVAIAALGYMLEWMV